MVENNHVSSPNSLAVDYKLLVTLFMYIRKSNGPKIEPCRIPAIVDDQLERLLLKTTPWNLLLKKLLSGLRRLSDIPTCSSLNSNPSCHTLSKVSSISRVGC